MGLESMTLKQVCQGPTRREITQNFCSIGLCQIFVLDSPGFDLQAPRFNRFPSRDFILQTLPVNTASDVCRSFARLKS